MNKSHLKIQLLGALTAIVTILILWQPVQTPDWDRYESQAISIVENFEYSTFGKPETSLAPGYPILIATIYFFGGNQFLVLIIQSLLVVATCLLVFRALLPKNTLIASLAMFTLAIHPFVARSSSYYLSESLGIFLCCLMIYFLSQVLHKNESRSTWFLLGLFAIALALTSPGAAVLSAAVCLYLLSKNFNKFYLTIPLMTGILVFLIPWQIHCLKSTGNVCVTLYKTDVIIKRSGFSQWYRSWAQTQKDLNVFYRPENIVLTPDQVFKTKAQKNDLMRARINDTENLDSLYASAALERINSDSFSYFVTLPLIRAFNLWFDMNQVSHIQMEYVGRIGPVTFKRNLDEVGLERAVLRLGKAVISTLVYLLYIFYPLFMLFSLAYFIKTKKTLPLLIIFSILIYTLISGYTGMIESRRNLLFLPAIAFLMNWIELPKKFSFQKNWWA